MHFFAVPYFIGLIIFCGLVVLTYKQKPWLLFLSGIGITIFGAFFGLDISHYGNSFGREVIQQLGQSFQIVISVVGGGLVSSAVSEIRENHNRSLTNPNMNS